MKKYVNYLLMGGVVRGLSLVSLSFSKVIPPYYGDMWGVYKYNGSTSLLRAERGTKSRAEPSRVEKLKHLTEIFENITPPFEIKSLSSDRYAVCDL